MPVPPAYRILPELFLTITGVLVMLIEPVMPSDMSRKPIGFLALAGTIGALLASVWQLGLDPGTAFYGTVQTDAFSAFFHVVILSVVLVALLIAFDVFDGCQRSVPFRRRDKGTLRNEAVFEPARAVQHRQADTGAPVDRHGAPWDVCGREQILDVAACHTAGHDYRQRLATKRVDHAGNIDAATAGVDVIACRTDLPDWPNRLCLRDKVECGIERKRHDAG